jgi:hypothetical protein
MATSVSLREQILARLAVVIKLQGIDGASVLRNSDILDDVILPAVVLHDGDEEALAADAMAPGSTGGIMVMNPQITLLFGSTPEQIGTDGNAWLAKLQKAILLDSTGTSSLSTLCRGVPRGGPRYVRSALAIHEGDNLKGEITAQFSITYPFNPRSL